MGWWYIDAEAASKLFFWCRKTSPILFAIKIHNISRFSFLAKLNQINNLPVIFLSRNFEGEEKVFCSIIVKKYNELLTNHNIIYYRIIIIPSSMYAKAITDINAVIWHRKKERERQSYIFLFFFFVSISSSVAIPWHKITVLRRCIFLPYSCCCYGNNMGSWK